jgi:hypothetical protein
MKVNFDLCVTFYIYLAFFLYFGAASKWSYICFIYCLSYFWFWTIRIKNVSDFSSCGKCVSFGLRFTYVSEFLLNPPKNTQ